MAAPPQKGTGIHGSRGDFPSATSFLAGSRLATNLKRIIFITLPGANSGMAASLFPTVVHTAVP